jgi:sugar lactone lactonase YvrE
VLVNIGRTTYFLGNGSTAGHTDGTGTGPTGALLNRPLGCAVDPNGNLYFADTQNSVIRRVAAGSSTPIVILGALNVTGNVQSNGTLARFGSPYAVRFASDFTAGFVTDFANHQILRVTIPAGAVTLFAGLAAGTSGNTDATGAVAEFNQPADLAIRTSTTDMFVTEVAGNRVRKVTSAAVVTLFAGSATAVSGATDATGSAASFQKPIGIVVIDTDGRMLVADSANAVIRQITAAQVVTTVAGTAGVTGSAIDGTGAGVRFIEPWGLALSADAGFVFIADKGNNQIRRMSTTTLQVVTVVGQGVTGWASSAVSTSALINAPNSVCLSTLSTAQLTPRLYITGDHSISYVSLSRTLTVTMTMPTPAPNGTTTTTGAGTTTTRAATTTTAAGNRTTTVAPTPTVINGTTAAPTTTGASTAPPNLSAAPARASVIAAAIAAVLVAVFAL